MTGQLIDAFVERAGQKAENIVFQHQKILTKGLLVSGVLALSLLPTAMCGGDGFPDPPDPDDYGGPNIPEPTPSGQIVIPPQNFALKG